MTWTKSVAYKIIILYIFEVLRRDLQAKKTGPTAKGHSCGKDERLDITGCTEAFLDGPYDIGYSRFER